MNALIRLVEDRVLAYVSSKVTAMSVAMFLTSAVASIQEATGFGVDLDIPPAVYLWVGTFVAAAVGWVVRERRPSPSAIEAIEVSGVLVKPPGGSGGHPNRGIIG